MGEEATVMRPPMDLPWEEISEQLQSAFGYSSEEIEKYNALESDKDGLMMIYKAMEKARGFENACNQQYMQGKIRGFMHLDNGQESIPALVSGVDAGEVMAELFMKETGSCKGAGGS